MNEQNTDNVCAGGPGLIFACSGAADVGAVADQVARKLSAEGVGQMFCLAGLGGKVDPIIQKTKSASRILAIDGCPLDCAKKSVELSGVSAFGHLRVTDLGFDKGSTKVDPETIGVVAKRCKEIIVGQ